MTKPDEIEELFRSNYRAMFLLANRLLHDEEMARDIVHDVFASVLTAGIDSVNSAYLMNGVRFACLKLIRNLSVRDRVNRLYSLDLQEIEDDEWPDEETIASVHNIIDRELPQTTGRILRLRFNARMSYREIADHLAVSEVTVYKHLRHAMIVLRKFFNDYER